MTSTLKVSDYQKNLNSPKIQAKKHHKITEKTYKNNVDSDYTEKIKELDKSFVYKEHSDYYWSEPELSILYGSPLYEQASSSQKIALNHLYWATQYNQTAATEANAVLYNQITAGVFATMSEYNTLCQELDLETIQERSHIHAFHAIGYKTKRALLGKMAFNVSAKKTSKYNIFSKTTLRNRKLFNQNQQSFSWEKSQEHFLHFITSKILLRNQGQYYSQYLKELNNKGESLPAQTTGLLGQLVSRPQSKFLTLNCGSSPFLATVFYVTRFLANMLLKNYEYRYSKYYRNLEKKDKFIPAPTAISHYHLLDEGFHTTTSGLISQELYKDFAKPIAYEKFVANLIVYRAQSLLLSGLSGSLPGIFKSDELFMPSLYRLLQANPFNMSDQESLHWIEKCLCHEHQGFYVNLKYHQSLLSDIRRAFSPINYLWASNREMSLMASGNSVNQAVQSNSKAFKQFSRAI